MAFSPQLWSAATNAIMLKELKITQRLMTTVTDYTNMVKGKKADAYNGPSLGDVTVYSLPIDLTNFAELAEVDFNLPFTTGKGVPILVSDVSELQTNLATRNIYTQKSADALLDAYDASIANAIILGLASAQRLEKTDDTTNKITQSDFAAAKLLLNTAKAPLTGRYAVLNVTDEGELTSIANFISRDKLPNQESLKNGVVGMIDGFQIIMYNAMPLVDLNGILTGTKDKKVNLFYHEYILGFGRQKELGVKVAPSAGTPGDYLNTWTVYGAKVHTNRDDYAVSVRDNVISE